VRAMTLCNGPGEERPCPTGEIVRRGRCPACERAWKDKVNLRYRKATTNVRQTDRHWRMIRARFLAEHDTCEHEGCEMPATDVHHKLDRAEGGDSSFGNLEALCKSHHSKVTAERQARVVPARRR